MVRIDQKCLQINLRQSTGIEIVNHWPQTTRPEPEGTDHRPPPQTQKKFRRLIAVQLDKIESQLIKALAAFLISINLDTLEFSLLTTSAALLISYPNTLPLPIPVIDTPINASFSVVSCHISRK